jgi:hypothetical protein
MGPSIGNLVSFLGYFDSAYYEFTLILGKYAQDKGEGRPSPFPKYNNKLNLEGIAHRCNHDSFNGMHPVFRFIEDN